MDTIGLHLRMPGTFAELIRRALQLELPFFQCFFTDRKTGRVISPESSDVRSFLQVRRVYFNNLYVHASFFINLAAVDRRRHPILSKEIELAKQLEFTHMVIHPGTVRKSEEKEKGIDAIARTINYLTRHEHDIQILLENTAYGALSIGSIIEDFHILLTKLDQPDRIGFCIDTAHAHLAGYDIISSQGYEHFLLLLEKVIGLKNITLIHLNETCKACGSHVDIHGCVGDKYAVLGDNSLKRFTRDERFKEVPMLLELPAMSMEDEQRIIKKVNTWRCT